MFFSASIASVVSCPGQLFSVIRQLTIPLLVRKVVYYVAMTYLQHSDNVSALHQDLAARFGVSKKLETLCVQSVSSTCSLR